MYVTSRDAEITEVTVWVAKRLSGGALLKTDKRVSEKIIKRLKKGEDLLCDWLGIEIELPWCRERVKAPTNSAFWWVFIYTLF